MTIDGTVLDAPDTPENDKEFGRPASSRGEGSAFTQIRVAGLAECGTRAVVGVAMGACTTGETTLARGLLGSIRPDMLVMADRGFFSFGLWNEVRETGAQLLWRTKSNHVLPVDERLADGSYISHIQAVDDRKLENSVRVRVVEYVVEDPGRPQAEDTKYRLITTLLDPAEAPAAELAGLYPQRWEFETTLDELKTHQRGPRVVLRSKSPDGIRQEVYGHLCTHYAIRALMQTTATNQDVDPDRLSFTRAQNAARRSVRAGLGAAAHALAVALPAAIAEICRELLPHRLRSNPRVVKRKMSKFPVKRKADRDYPQPTLSPAQAIRVLGVDIAMPQ